MVAIAQLDRAGECVQAKGNMQTYVPAWMWSFQQIRPESQFMLIDRSPLLDGALLFPSRTLLAASIADRSIGLKIYYRFVECVD